jgi:hypothetical protein
MNLSPSRRRPATHLLSTVITLSLTLLTGSAHAAESGTAAADPATLRAQAQALRDQAEATFAATQPACYQRFFVNRCLDQAREARLADINRARALDIQASRIELAEKQREFAARHGVEATPVPPPAELPTPIAEPQLEDDIQRQADEIRRARAAAAEAAEARAQQEQLRRDAERAQERQQAEEEAARRAAAAERDRQRYQERIDAHRAEQASPVTPEEAATE